jgi:hypothetical protein
MVVLHPAASSLGKEIRVRSFSASMLQTPREKERRVASEGNMAAGEGEESGSPRLKTLVVARGLGRRVVKSSFSSHRKSEP